MFALELEINKLWHHCCCSVLSCWTDPVNPTSRVRRPHFIHWLFFRSWEPLYANPMLKFSVTTGEACMPHPCTWGDLQSYKSIYTPVTFVASKWINLNVYVYSLISKWVQQISKFTPVVLELSLSLSLIQSHLLWGEFSICMLYAAIASHYNLAFLFHQIPITAEWTKAAWQERLVQHLYTWPATWFVHWSPIQLLTRYDVA